MTATTRPISSENEMCSDSGGTSGMAAGRSSGGAVGGAAASTYALAPAGTAIAGGDSSARIHASSTTVSPRTIQPASGTSASPAAAAASARGRESISQMPMSAPSGSAQYQAGSVTSPS